MIGAEECSVCCSVVNLLYDSHTSRELMGLLERCAATALNSKLIAGQKEFFSKMVVDAVMMLDELLPLKMIGVKKVHGGALEVSADS